MDENSRFDVTYPIEQSTGEVISETPTEVVEQQVLPKLTVDEDTFCLAVIEYGGNLRYAYESAYGVQQNPVGKARMLISRPEIAIRIRELTEAVTENCLISLGSHLVELADIRDLAKASGQLKVALGAEQSRGQVAGFYAGKLASKPGTPSDNPMVVIQINNEQDRRI